MNRMYYNVRYDGMVILPYFNYFTQASPHISSNDICLPDSIYAHHGTATHVMLCNVCGEKCQILVCHLTVPQIAAVV